VLSARSPRSVGITAGWPWGSAIWTNSNLNRCIGHTLIHTDGTTLLGADDKAGIAEIMTMLAWLDGIPTCSTARSGSHLP